LGGVFGGSPPHLFPSKGFFSGIFFSPFKPPRVFPFFWEKNFLFQKKKFFFFSFWAPKIFLIFLKNFPPFFFQFFLEKKEVFWGNPLF